MKMLEHNPTPRFDFCFIDGAHSWFTDGFAFFLVDRLLKPGGLLIFDDLNWTYASSPALSQSEWVAQMPKEEKETAQVRKVYELLVKPHPAYGEFIEKDGWAYARKVSTQPDAMAGAVRSEVIYQKQHVGLGYVLLKVARRIRRQLAR